MLRTTAYTTVALLLAAAVFAAPTTASADVMRIIGINPADSRVFMSATDLAGANADVRVGNWNNYASTNTTLEGDDLVFSDGTTVGGDFQVDAFSSRGFSAVSSAVNDELFYVGRPDMRDGDYMEWVVSDIPFDIYDVYVYARGTASDRGGSIAVTGQTTLYTRDGNAANDDGTGYVQITGTSYDPNNPGDGVPAGGNFAHFASLTDSDLTIRLDTLDMGNTSVQRFHAVGFQLVEIPEPGSLALLGAGAALLLVRRRPAQA